MKSDETVTDPIGYSIKYGRNYTQAAYEHALSADTMSRYARGVLKPSAQSRRISQLLDYMRSHGIEPPPPLFFND